MGLLIKPTETKKIYIVGTTIELPEVYMRLEFACRANGVSLEIVGTVYVNKDAYKMGQPIFTDIQTGNIYGAVQINEVQGMETAHKYAKMVYEELGYTVEVDLPLQLP